MIWPAAFAILLAVAIVAAGMRKGRGALLARLREEWGKPIDRVRNIDAIATSHRSRVAEAGTDADSLDDRTWEDLNMDDVCAAIDRTRSTLGQHALYHRLRTAPTGNQLDAFEALVNRMSADVPARERAQLALARLQDAHGYDLWFLARPNAIEAPHWYVAFPILTGATIVLALIAPFWPALLPQLARLLVLNVIVWIAVARQVSGATRAFRQLAPVVATGEALEFLTGHDIEPLIASIHSDVPKLRRLKTIARWVSEDPFMLSGSWNMAAVAITDLANLVYYYLSVLLHLDENGVYFGARDLRVHGRSIVRVVSALGEVDAAISVASYRAERSDWTRPRFLPAESLTVLTDVRHPLVSDAVPNTITLRPGHGALVTGSNMSGKSTFLRTVGVTTVLAQTLNTCLATAYSAPILKVRSSIGRADDLLAGKSYYIVEVETLLGLVGASEGGTSHLFLLDELFRGTNAVERIAAGQAVLHELAAGGTGSKPHVVVAATHDGELIELLQERFVAYHFEDAVGPEGLVFNHRLQPGPATTRNAIALLRLHGAPKTLVDRALDCAAALDRQRRVTLTAR